MTRTATDKKYTRLVDEWNKAGRNVVKRPICYLTNWWQISQQEAAQFGIDPTLNNALCLAYTRFQNMAGITDSGLWIDADAISDQERYHPYISDNTGAEIKWHGVAAARFMSEVCQLPYQDCAGYIEFITSAMDRAGLVSRTIRSYQ